MKYAAFYFERLHQDRFWTQVETVEDEQDAYLLRESLGCPDLLGLYDTEEQARRSCDEREMYEAARGWAV
jgi:hypothetical protein